MAAVFDEAHPDPFIPQAFDLRGDYRWSVLSDAGRPLASRGYSTLFDEWQSTVVGAGEDVVAQFSESHVVPWFAGASVRFEKRVRGDAYRTLLEHALPAAAPTLEAAEREAPADRQVRQLHGAPGAPLSVLLVAEGYTADEAEAFFEKAAQVGRILLAAEPYRARADAIAVRALLVPSPASGIPATPDADRRLTNFSTSYGVFGMDRYLVATDLHRLRALTGGIAATTLIVLANAPHYGGSGIFNSNCCVAAGMTEEDLSYVLLHELGHSFGGLADEYFGSEVPYVFGADVTPWEPNVSVLDASGRVKWSSRIAPDTPVPTPWGHAEYLRLSTPPPVPESVIGEQSASRNQASAQSRRDTLAALLAQEPHAGLIGAFEGARYMARGLFRPEVDCRMFSRSAKFYCRICNETLIAGMALAMK
ncbi:M64 family metallopeptidase [Variovorax rhizosphaerae]|uniref:M64 family metallopeptidase n=1 Tax=Variovorax rhizosphaerae TaxID=1836200 RepID=A0ABU8WF30_9BURK